MAWVFRHQLVGGSDNLSYYNSLTTTAPRTTSRDQLRTRANKHILSAVSRHSIAAALRGGISFNNKTGVLVAEISKLDLAYMLFPFPPFPFSFSEVIAC